MNAAPDKIEDAAQEFLTDWLVRRHYDQALAMLSSRSYACVALKAGARGEQLDAAGSRRELLRVMEYATQKLGPRPDLTSAIVAFTPRDPNRPILDHAFRREFLVGVVPETEARQYMCDASTAPSVPGAQVLRRHLHVPDRWRRNAGTAVDARSGRVEDRVLPVARTVGAAWSRPC